MSRVKHISFEQLAGNLAEILNNVRAERASIVVEYDNGDHVLIKPYSPSHRGARAEQRKGVAPDEDDSPLQHPPDHALDSENISSMGAVYDLDPGSITPG
jgi:hypothetical protein